MTKYRIMTFDGGGVRGALTVSLLKRLSTNYSELLKSTDLFAGTSTGSFIALGLASGMSPDQLVELYSVDKAKYIFTPKHLEMFRPKYNNIHLKEILVDIFGEDMRLRDLKHYVVVPSFRLRDARTENWAPILFNNFPHSDTSNEKVVDVALASSAAPIYFPSYQNHVDGGLVANNPSLAAIAMAKDERAGNQKLDNIHLLSIGTGFYPNQVESDTSKWGAMEWILHANPPIPLLSLLMDGVSEADTIFSGQLLGDRHRRINPRLTEQVALDEYRKIPDLIKNGEEYDLTREYEWIKKNWF